MNENFVQFQFIKKRLFIGSRFRVCLTCGSESEQPIEPQILGTHRELSLSYLMAVYEKGTTIYQEVIVEVIV